ncbi:MAG: hypothetical protein H0T44_00135 [Gemmatimonadales bacterium]|nr:hypothetical protein [Gemmatimonadales bacterium]
MPSYICVIDCEIDADELARQPSLEDQAADVLGEHVYELDASDRDNAEREALETFHREYPGVSQFGDRVDLSVVARRRTAGDKPVDTSPRRGRGRPQADGEPYGGAERREALFE